MARFDIQITAGSNLPIYRQIVDQVRLAIAAGTLIPGDQLPSVRSIAESLLVNPNTVARAYGELTRDGLLDARPGKGLFIAERRQRLSQDERDRLLTEAAQEFARRVALLDFSRAEVLARADEMLKQLEPDPQEAPHG